MTTADQADQASSSIPTSRKVLCIVYGAIAVAALIATWSQIHSVSDFLVTFWGDTKVNSASRFIAVEALMLSASVAILTVIEGRKYHVRWVWLYIAGALIAASVAFPLFLIARELRMGGSETPHLRTVETILLAILVCGLAGLSVWIDMG
jgi:hypothetical protein